MSREYPCVYYKNGTCTEDSEPGYVSPCVMGPCSKETPSNADSIRAMRDEELAWVFMEFRVSCYAKSIGDEGSFPDTYHGILQWLQQPVMERTLSKKLAETEK